MIENASIFYGIVPPPDRMPIAVVLLCIGFVLDWVFVKTLIYFAEK